ncbi:MAG TPA: hypothetical protein V6C65_38660 [Allocoleopsis sp.]
MKNHHKTVPLVATLFLTLVSWKAFGDGLCGNVSSPQARGLPFWYRADCSLPEEFTNPDLACKARSFLKKHGYSPEKSGDFGLVPVIIDGYYYPPLETQAWKLCEKAMRIRCMQAIDYLGLSYNNLLNIHFGSEKAEAIVYSEPNPLNKPVDFNVDRNLRYLNARNEQALSAIATVSNEISQKIDQFSNDQNASFFEREIIDRFSALRSQLIDLSVQERKFYSMTDALIGKIAYMNQKVGNLTNGFECESTAVPDLAKLISDTASVYNSSLKELNPVVDEVRKEVHDRAQQRSFLMSQAYFKTKYKFYKKLGVIRGKVIEDVMNDIFRDLALDKILWQVTDWWATVSSNGLAGRLHTKYYYYSEPLRILRSEKENANQFKVAIQSLSGIEKSVAQEALKAIDEKIAVIDSNIAFIQTKGWSNLLKLQKDSAAKRAALLPGNISCQEATKYFFGKAEKVSSVESFDSVSPLYRITVDKCVK